MYAAIQMKMKILLWQGNLNQFEFNQVVFLSRDLLLTVLISLIFMKK